MDLFIILSFHGDFDICIVIIVIESPLDARCTMQYCIQLNN